MTTEKTEFESRISFYTIKQRGKIIHQANIFWKGQAYETIKATKEKCIAELKRQAGAE